jgi:hypothetical protein
MAFKRPDGTYTLEVQIRGHRFTRETDITCPEKARRAQARFKKAEAAARDVREAGTRKAELAICRSSTSRSNTGNTRVKKLHPTHLER